jgi:hypothetical protein
VSRPQAIAALELAREMLISHARSTGMIGIIQAQECVLFSSD